MEEGSAKIIKQYEEATRLIFDCARPVTVGHLGDGIIITKEAYHALVEIYYGL